MADTIEPLLQECATCGALIDVSDEEPFALMHCPTCGAAMRVRRQFGNFELQEILGAGGMGAVYRALDTALGRSVALKLLRKELTQDPDFVRQFEHEASITALINHPNVVKVYSTASDHGLVYIAMELVDKGSLDDLMTLQGSIAEPQVLEVGIQIAQGLNAAYRRGLIHRDVKPGNILFADAHHAKIVDFGLARLMDHSAEVSGEVWGTPYYVAPEKLDTPPKEDLRSDIYSLGATLFHALAGRPPYEAEDASMVALKHLKSQPVSLQAFAPNVSNATAYVINRTLNKDPEQRYTGYEELIEHLEYARSELLASGNGLRPKTRIMLEDERSQRMMSWVTLGILAALVFGGAALFVYRDKLLGPGPKPTPPPHVVVAGQYEARYKEAQSLLAGNKVGEAIAAFEKLEAEPNLPQPLHNWTTLQLGLGHLCDNRLKEAQADFQKLVERGPYSFDPAEEKLANFFPAVGRLILETAPAPATVAKDYSKSNYEAIALLLLATKDWDLDDFDDAGPLYRQFYSASPAAPDDWIAHYKDLARQYIAAYSAFRQVPERIKGAHTLEQKKAVLVSLKEAVTHPEFKGKLGEKAVAMIDDFEKEVAAAEAEQTQKLAAREAADSKALAEAKAKLNALCLDYKFGEAKAYLSSVKVTGEKAVAEKGALQKRMDRLAEFKALLIDDVNALGSAGPITNKNGGAVAAGLAHATDSQLEIKNPYGVGQTPWSEVSKESMYALACTFLRPGLPADARARRELGLGVFALTIGKTREGNLLLQDAIKFQPGLHDEARLMFPEFESAAPPAPAPATASP